MMRLGEHEIFYESESAEVEYRYCRTLELPTSGYENLILKWIGLNEMMRCLCNIKKAM